MGKCPVGEVSCRGIVRSGKCPSGKCQSVICPRGSVRSGNCPTIIEKRCTDSGNVVLRESIGGREPRKTNT